MRGFRKTLEKIKITNDLAHLIQISSDEATLFLKVEYMDGRFVAEKMFRNNHFGAEELAKASENFNTEEKVINHFNLGDRKNGK